jgi:hypothetical protein
MQFKLMKTMVSTLKFDVTAADEIRSSFLGYIVRVVVP